MKTFLSVLTALIVWSCTYAQTQTTPANVTPTSKGPIIQFEEETHDFGSVQEGAPCKWEFVFKNVGDKPLLLKDVQPGCGCTASEWPKEPIMPGQTNKIIASFNSNGYGGRSFQKGITVTTNMLENPTKVIFFKGSVVAKTQPEEVTPPQSPVRVSPL